MSFQLSREKAECVLLLVHEIGFFCVFSQPVDYIIIGRNMIFLRLKSIEVQYCNAEYDGRDRKPQTIENSYWSN